MVTLKNRRFKLFLSVLISLVFAACSSTGDINSALPGFKLNLNPVSTTVSLGGQTTTSLTITPTGGFSGPVSITLVSPPSGVSVSPTSTAVNGTTKVDLTIATSTSTPAGSHDLSIRVSGAKGSPSKTATFRLIVSANQNPLISSFTVNPATGTAPLDVTFGWNISDPDGDTLTCKLDVNSDGIFEYSLPNCTSNTIQAHTYSQAGNYTAKLRVEDGNGGSAESTVDISVATATKFTVNTTADTIDAAPGDGDCGDANGGCSLRAAIMEANANPGTYVITLPAGTYVLTRPSGAENNVQYGDLDIQADLTIEGAGAANTIIDAAGQYRVFEVMAGYTVTISGVTIQGGNAGFYDGGAIYNSGDLTLRNVTIRDNAADDGGGIYNDTYNDATLVVENSTFERNSTSGSYGYGEAIYGGTVTLRNVIVRDHSNAYVYAIDARTITMENSTITNNAGGGVAADLEATIANSTISNNGGAGIRTWGSYASITDSTISSNGGRGIHVNGTDSVTITNTTISSNSGRGVYFYGYYSSETLTITNSTVSGNTDGGVYEEGFGTIRLSFTTITQNTTTGNGGGLYVDSNATAELKGVILSGNSAGTAGPECYGAIISRGYNLIKNNDGCTFTVATGDITNQDADLAPLADNGGPTQTHLPNPTSPVLDRVPAGSCTDLGGNALSADQRGVSRPQGSACDIGSVERQ